MMDEVLTASPPVLPQPVHLEHQQMSWQKAKPFPATSTLILGEKVMLEHFF